MKGLIIALQFMTRIPINIKLEITDEEFGSSSKFFPLVGFIMGLILALFIYLAQGILPIIVVGAMIIIFEIMLTGGIHLDGFMDTMDGLLSARPKEKIFEIMQDSRVGAHSVTSLFCLLILKFSILVALPVYLLPLIVFFMPGIGRWFMLFCLVNFPYAKEEGLGKIFWKRTKKEYFFLNTFFIIILIPVILAAKYLFAFLLTFLLALTPALLINKKLNGHTGDTYGAITEITEIIFLFVCLLISSFF